MRTDAQRGNWTVQRGNLSGTRSVVTGGSRGIGFRIAEALVKEGVRTVICGRSEGALQEAVERLGGKGSQIQGKVCDVGRPEPVEELIRFSEERLGGLDILINNAAVGVFRSVAEMTPEEWRTLMRTNLDSLFYCCHYALPVMRRSGGGFIINIGSLAGKNAFPQGAAYCASKFGLKAFSEALMQEVRYDDIRVAYVMPGSVNTGFAGNPPAEESWKLSPRDVADVVIDTLRRDPRCLTSRIEMRPAKPPK